MDLNPTTSVPWLRSWHLRGVACQLVRRSMAPGVVAWRCTQSHGSEQGRSFLFYLPPPRFSHASPVWILKSLIPLRRARRDYWEMLKPASGRPLCPSMSSPDGWGITKGHADLMQQKEATSQEQLKALFDKANKGNWAPLPPPLMHLSGGKKLRGVAWEAARSHTFPSVYIPK